ncbi:hypothetical protein RvY_07676-2 [Ramazzottius varieornatus]|uniref:Uncharacterized protein n=1 Tax=Ramazzottius varieornatus TaxID=947166 RepID=A0A1D1VBE6_RAMVA|nr:hypothetical protein RvY_07676-2 [Ramazzottius varieornatus]
MSARISGCGVRCVAVFAGIVPSTSVSRTVFCRYGDIRNGAYWILRWFRSRQLHLGHLRSSRCGSCHRGNRNTCHVLRGSDSLLCWTFHRMLRCSLLHLRQCRLQGHDCTAPNDRHFQDAMTNSFRIATFLPVGTGTLRTSRSHFCSFFHHNSFPSFL